jgi:tetratricopeptide (TPR) repeat protein
VKYISAILWGIFILGTIVFLFQSWLRALPLPNLPVFLTFLRNHFELLILGLILWSIIARLTFRLDAIKRLEREVWFYKPWSRLKPFDINPNSSWFDPYFIKRAAVKEVLDALRNRPKQIGVLLLGGPLIGKTRCGYEALKKMKGFHVLGLVPRDQDVKDLRIPRSYAFRKPKVVLFLDDLQGYVGKFTPNQLYQHLSRQTRSFTVLATCRSGREMETIDQDQAFRNFVKQSLRQIHVQELSKREEQELADHLGRAWTPLTYNGTPGSIVFDLDEMRNRLESATLESVALMRALFLMRRAGIQLYRRILTEYVAREVYELSADRGVLERAWRTLSSADFLTVEQSTVVPAHAVYIEDSFWEDYEAFDTDRDLESLWQLVLREDSAAEILDMTVNWSLNGNHERAWQGFEKYLTLVPGHVEARFLAGGTLLQLGHAARDVGDMTEGRNKIRAAEQMFREVLQHDPDDASAHYALASALTDLNARKGEIQQELREAIRCDLDFAEAHFALGASLQTQGRLRSAEQEYFEAARSDPKYPSPHYGLARIYKMKGRLGQARHEMMEFERLTKLGEWRNDP